MLLLRFVVVLAVSFLAFPISAQDSPQRDPQAVALLARSHAAMGGAALSGVSDTRAEITIRSHTGGAIVESTAVLKTLGRKAWRMEGSGAGGNSATVINGDRGSSNANGEAQEFPVIAVAEAGNWRIPWLSIIGDWNEPDIEATYVGLEENGTVHRVRLQRKPANGFAEVYGPCDVLIDAQTGLPLKLTFSMHPPENLLVDVPVEVDYSEYRQIHGLLIPVRIRFHIGRTLASETVVNQFSLNVGASPAEFEVR